MAVERILVYGPESVGKTYQLLKIAQWLLGTGAQFYVLDTDDSYPRSMEEFPPLPNVHVTFGFDWPDYVEWLADVRPRIVAGRDWLVGDRIDKAWTAAQDWVSTETYGIDLGARLIEARKAIAKKRAMVVGANDQADWQIVNAQYRPWFNTFAFGCRAHVYMTASMRGLRGNDDGETRRIYGPLHGQRPAGHPTLGHEPNTSLFLHRDDSGQRLMSTAKDRARPFYWQQPLISLPQQYLMAVGGWSNQTASINQTHAAG